MGWLGGEIDGARLGQQRDCWVGGGINWARLGGSTAVWVLRESER